MRETFLINYRSSRIVSFLFKVLEHVPLLLYILAAKTLILCLAFAGAKVYQRKKLEAKRQKLEAEKTKQSEKKDN